MEIFFRLNEIPNVAKQILEQATSKNILFYGAMGAGKTTIIKEMGKILGICDEMGSPTFSLVNEYFIENGKVNHFDFYRIEKAEEALDIGLEEYFDGEAWNLVEWPEKIDQIFYKNANKVLITKIDMDSRMLKMMPMK